MPTKQNVDGVL